MVHGITSTTTTTTTTMVLSDVTFKESVRAYIELHDDITKMSKDLTVIKKKKDELGKEIIDFMKTNNIDEFQVPDGKLVRKKTKRTQSVSQATIVKTLKTALGDERSEALMQTLNAQRKVKETESLCRTKTSGDDDE